MLNDFRNLGFNQAENGKNVFDGMMQWIAAGDGINMNYRFSQPGRTQRNRQDHLYLEGVFPFANQTTTDPITGKTAGRYDACTEIEHLPVGDGDLFGERVLGEGRLASPHRSRRQGDLPDHPKVARIYLISSHQHGTATATPRATCQQFLNPLNSAPVQRALWEALDQWVDQGRRAAAEQGSESCRRHAGARAAAERDGLPEAFPASPIPG